MEAFDSLIVPKIDEFKPQFLLVSAGFDAAIEDHLAEINLTTACFEWIVSQACGSGQKALPGQDRVRPGRGVCPRCTDTWRGRTCQCPVESVTDQSPIAIFQYDPNTTRKIALQSDNAGSGERKNMVRGRPELRMHAMRQLLHRPARDSSGSINKRARPSLSISACPSKPSTKNTARRSRAAGRSTSCPPANGFDCIFLKRDKEGKSLCSIYPVRPTQCRTWPFWPENLKTPRHWARAAKNCPGMKNGGTFYPIEQVRIILNQNKG